VLMLNNLKNAEPKHVDLIKITVWTMSNLFRGKPFPDKEYELLLPYLSNLLDSGIDDVVNDTLWILSYITDCKESECARVDRIIELIPKVVSIISDTDIPPTPAIRTIGNICSGTEAQTNEVLKSDFLKLVRYLLSNQKRIVRKETAWTISNISAGTHEQIQKLIENDIFSILIEGLNDSEYEVVRECCYCIFNLIEGTSTQQFERLMSEKCLESLIELLDYPDTKVLKVVLDSIECILNRGKKLSEKNMGINPFVMTVQNYGNALALLEDLQNHENHDIFNLCFKILGEHFDGKETSEVMIENQNKITNTFNLESNFNG